MALSKTWYSDMDCASPDNGATSAKGMFWLFKAMLAREVTGTTGPAGSAPGGSLWTCAGSSDAVTAGMDAVDRLTSSYDVSKIVASAAGAMSWIVMQHPSAGYQILFGLKQATANVMDLYYSQAGFTGGTTTAYPTATDTVQHVNHTYHDSSSTNYNGHITRDADGYFHIIYGKVSTSRVWGRIDFPLMVDTDVSDIQPVCLLTEYNSTTSVGTAQSTIAAARNVGNTSSFVSAGSCEQLFISGQSTNINSTAVSAALLADGTAATFPTFIWLPGATPKQIKGRIPDVLQSFQQFPVGSTEPVTGDQERLQLLNFLLPFTAPATL